MTRNFSAVAAVGAALVVCAQAFAGGAPPNNNFQNARVLNPSGETVSGSTVGADKETGEPSHNQDAGATASVWYRLTPTAAGTVSISPCGSSVAIRTAVYTGSSVDNLSKERHDEKPCPSGKRRGFATRQITFSATAGTTYSIAVASYPPGGAISVTNGFTAGGGGGADTTAPDTTITKGPKKKTKKKKATFEFTSDEAGTAFQCSLNGGGFELCTSPWKLKGKKGKNRFEVRAIDASGNVDQSPATYDWKVKKKKRK